MGFKGTPVVLDNANRADGGPPLSGNWTAGHTPSGTGHRVVSNTIRGATTGAVHASRWSAASFAADQYAGITLTASQGTGNDAAVDLRIQNVGVGATDLIRVRHWRRAADDDIQVSLIADGSNATARVGPLITKDFALGDALLAEVIGDQLLIYRRPAAEADYILLGCVYVPAATVPAATSTVGLYNWQSSATAPTLDDFLGGASNGHDHPIAIAGSTVAAEAASVPVPLPVHVENDVLFMFATSNVAADLSITSGWALVGSPINGAAMSMALWWRRVGAAETVATPTVTQSVAGGSTNAIAATPYRVRGCRTSGNPWEALSEEVPATTQSIVVPGMTSLGSNRTRFDVFGIDGPNSQAWLNVAASGPPPLTDNALVADNASTLGDDHRHVASVYEMPVANAYSGSSLGNLAVAAPRVRTSMVLVPPAAGVETTGAVTSVAVPSGTSDVTTPVETAGSVTSVGVAAGASGLAEPLGDATSRGVVTGTSGVESADPPVETAGSVTSVGDVSGVSAVAGTVTTTGLVTSVAVATGTSGVVTPVETTGGVTSVGDASGVSGLTGDVAPTAPPRTCPGPLPWAVFGGVEIGNAARVVSYLQNPQTPGNPHGVPGVSPSWRITDDECGCPCPILYTDGAGNPVTYTRPDLNNASGDPAPWFEAGLTQSTEFLGVYITNIEGLDSTVTRVVNGRGTLPGGGTMGPQYLTVREVKFEAVLVATSGRGLEYGRRWLSHTLANDTCDACEAYELELRATCPDGTGGDGADEGLINLYDVALTAGPTRTTPGPGVPDFMEVSWTLTATDPHVYECPEVCLPRITQRDRIAQGGDTGGWECGFDPPTPFGVTGLLVTVDVAVDDSDVHITGWTAGVGEPCGVAMASQDPCYELLLDNVPAGSRIVLDGARRQLLIRAADGTWSDALPYVTLTDGQPFDWPESTGCLPTCVRVTAGPKTWTPPFKYQGPTPDDAAVEIATRQRFLT